MAQENGYLFVLQLAFVDLQHAGDNEKARLQFTVRTADGLDLGSLGNFYEIFDGQRMQLILGGQRVNHFHVREPVNVDPAHGRPLRAVMRQEVVQIVHILNQDLILTVIDAADVDRRRPAGQLLDFIIFNAGSRAGLAFAEMQLRCHTMPESFLCSDAPHYRVCVSKCNSDDAGKDVQ